MALLERVRTLIRANLNDLIDKAEDPEKMIKQLILDMENQLLQLKTQVAVAMADEHVLEKKLKENENHMAEWMHKAEIAVDKKQDDLARAALGRYQNYGRLVESFREQLEDQRVQVENLKSALAKLGDKLSEARAKSDLLIARHHRAKAVGKANDAHLKIGDLSKAAAFDRMQERVIHGEALSQAKAELVGDSIEERFNELQRDEEIDRLLAEVKSRRALNP
jgi:phage shock protein A